MQRWWYKTGFAVLCAASGLVLAIGATPPSMPSLQKRALAVAGAVAGAIAGIAHSIRGRPLLLL